MRHAKRPYLVRALYEWVLANDEVPYVLVDATVPGVQVPEEHVKDGQIVLNIGPDAVRDLQMTDEWVMCGSRFGGRPFELALPIASIKALYCKGSGDGLVFPEEPVLAAGAGELAEAGELGARSEAVADASTDDASPDGDGSDPGGDKPRLRLV